MSGRFKAVSIMNEDYDYFEVVRQKWIKRHAANLPMPQLLKTAVAELDKQLDSET